MRYAAGLAIGLAAGIATWLETDDLIYVPVLACVGLGLVSLRRPR